MNLIETGHHQVNADYDPSLGSHSFLAGAEGFSDAEVLFVSFEEQVDLSVEFFCGFCFAKMSPREHRHKLVPGSHTLARSRYRVEPHAAIELLAVDEIGNLSENKAARGHVLLGMNQTSAVLPSQTRYMPFSLYEPLKMNNLQNFNQSLTGR
jgi:hypothetical protein